MHYDYYADVAERNDPTRLDTPRPAVLSLVSGFADYCVWLSAHPHSPKEDARREYQKEAANIRLNLPSGLDIDSPAATFLTGWLSLEIEFTLQSPWYSRDDRPFHVLDNPLRKDRVFGVPFMAAASWKGLLRWACRMEADLLDHLEKHDGNLDGWVDPPWIVHLFGNERAEDEEFLRGALQFYPTWFDKIKVGFEVINPHSRKTRAGTLPIYYEVVPADTKGALRLLYAPAPNRDTRGEGAAIRNLLSAVDKLITRYGFSAKRTAGWGIASIGQASVTRKNDKRLQGDWPDVMSKLAKWIGMSEDSNG